jgi:hypothetical protein
MEASTSNSHQGQWVQTHNLSPNVRVQSLPTSQNELGAWQNGSVHVRMVVIVDINNIFI